MKKRDLVKREIERFPDCPELSSDKIREITRMVFIESKPEKADVLFVFGSSSNDQWQPVAQAYKDGLAPLIYLSGGTLNASGVPISTATKDVLIGLGIPQNAIIAEARSSNTLEDVKFAQDFFKRNSIRHGRILFACKAPHSGRCLRTMQKVFPKSKLFPLVYPFVLGGQHLTAENWSTTELGRSGIWGEYQRILLYSSRGDIAK